MVFGTSMNMNFFFKCNAVVMECAVVNTLSFLWLHVIIIIKSRKVSLNSFLRKTEEREFMDVPKTFHETT